MKVEDITEEEKATLEEERKAVEQEYSVKKADLQKEIDEM